jgi:DNA-binding MarR family transcriptional regulator
MGTIGGEIKQTRPFASAAEEAVVTLLRTGDRLGRLLSSSVEPRGITMQQYNVLRILRGAGSAGLPTLEIASRMIEQSPGITRLLDRLERKRLVRRERCPKDRRQVLCSITGSGRELLAALDGPVKQVGARCLEPLGAPGIRRLVRLLDSVRAAALPSDSRFQSRQETDQDRKEKR